MRRSIGTAATPEIEQFVLDLLKEDADYDNNENRTAHREHLVRHVMINIRRPEPQELTAFSRNISASGIGLITQELVPNNAVAALAIERLESQSSSMLSECRWCRPYGKNWFISGWHFINLQR